MVKTIIVKKLFRVQVVELWVQTLDYTRRGSDNPALKLVFWRQLREMYSLRDKKAFSIELNCALSSRLNSIVGNLENI